MKITDVDPKALQRTHDILIEMIGPRCPDCGDCDVNKAPSWAGEMFGWCECCTHEDTEPWCPACGKPCVYEHLCCNCGPTVEMRCLQCDEVITPRAAKPDLPFITCMVTLPTAVRNEFDREYLEEVRVSEGQLAYEREQAQDMAEYQNE